MGRPKTQHLYHWVYAMRVRDVVTGKYFSGRDGRIEAGEKRIGYGWWRDAEACDTAP